MGITVLASLIWKVLTRIQEAMLVATSVFAFMSLCVMVFLRYVLKSDLYGIEEVITLSVMWLYFIGGAYGSYKRGHISAGLMSIFIKNDRALNIVGIVQATFTSFLFTVAAYYSVNFLSWSINAGAKTSLHQIPYAVGHAAVTVGFILMAFYSLVYLILDIRKIYLGEKANKA